MGSKKEGEKNLPVRSDCVCKSESGGERHGEHLEGEMERDI